MKKKITISLLLLLFTVMGYSETITRIEAENYNDFNGVSIENTATASGGKNIGNCKNGYWIKFAGHEFSQYDTRFDVAAASRSSTTVGTAVGTIEFRIDSVTGPLIGTANIKATGAWTTYQIFSAAITQTTGTHDLYLVFRPAVGFTYVCNLDYFEKVTNDPNAVLYTLSNSVTPLNSGTIDANPSASSYTNGTQITLTANKNFGYTFSRWTDGNGTTVSTANPYVFTITANTTLVAEFQTVPTYTLSTTAQGAFGLGEFSIAPAGKDGAFSVYEAGTNVTVTALENDIVKFSNWSDNTTALSKSVTMNADTNVTGTFTNIPFIAGWTFKNDTYANPRVAELYSNVDNRPQLAAYHVSDDSQAPNVRLQNKGGKNGFCVWNFDRGQFFYFKTSFSTVGYKNINVSSGLIGHYYGCDQWTFQYSLDGITFYDVSSLTTINTSTITSIGGTLPVAAEGKGIVYLRWFPNVAGPKHGSDIDVTATILSNVIVKADEEEVATWNGNAWSNTTGPTASIQAIIDGAYSTATNGAFAAKKLTINSGKSLTINAGTNVTVQNEVINNGGSFVVENNANLIQVNNTTNTGNVVVNRSSNALYRLDYTMWSSPVANQNLVAFSPLTSQDPSRFYTYDSAAGAYSAIALPALTTTNFAAGTGYLIRMPNDASATTATAYSGIFTGVPNNGTVTLSGLTPDKFYAVGNPYPSTISAGSFFGANATGLTLYFWRKTNAASGSAYATYTSVGGTTTTLTSATPNGTIQVGQGFIVKTGAAATTLTFTNAMREVSPTSTQFFRTKATAIDRVWLNLTNTAGVFSQTLVGYMDGATQGVDAGIDGAYINDSSIALTSAINGEEYTIQGRPAFDPSDVVPLNFKTDVAGDYTIAIDHADGLFATGQDVYLVDSATGTETNLKTDAYTFSATTGTANSRFSLKYQKTLKVDAPAFNENSVTVYKNAGVLYVNSGANAISNITVFDIQGRVIAEQKSVNATSTVIKNLKSSQQVLIVKVTSEDNKVVNKKVVN